MTSLERRLLAASLLLGVLTLSIITGRTLLAAPHAPAVTGNFYGANEAYVAAGAVDQRELGIVVTSIGLEAK